MSFCIHPLLILNSDSLIKTYGKKYISWKWFKQKKDVNKFILNDALNLYPCGSCLNCINMKRFHWVKKLMIEKVSWKYTYFITITYNDQHYPGQLKVSDIQKFIKYLRFELKQKIKYFCCGEYGSRTKRAHYHLILFTDYELDLEMLKYTKNGILYESKLLNKCWRNKGYIWVAHDLNNMSFAYVSSYSNKTYLKKYQNQKIKQFMFNREKILQDNTLSGFQKYLLIDQLIPDILFKKNEFIIMSKKPPLGASVKMFRDAPSSLLKWLQKEHAKLLDPNNENDFKKMIHSDYCKELNKRKNEYEIFLKNNNLYNIIKTDEMLNKRNSSIDKKGEL